MKDYINYQLRPLCIRLLLLTGIYSIFRMVFYFANADSFPHCNFMLFIYGIRFDLSAIFYTNIIYIVAVLIPFSFYFNRIYRKICDIFFIAINSFFALLAYIDVAYYPYVLKRMTTDIFSYVQIGFDFKTLLPSFFMQFWYLILIFIATVIAIIFISQIKFTKSSRSPRSPRLLPLYKTIIFLTLMAISVICMRGGLQLRPISLIDTSKHTSLQNAPIISNTTFTLIQSFGKQRNIEKHYFQSTQEAELYFNPIINHISPCSLDCYPVNNVFIIILEGFSQYLIKGADSDTYQGYSPFLDSLLRRSISFNGIANGRRTIEALPAIFSGIPSLLDMSYLESVFANNYYYSPVEILKDKGYNTVFFHGAKNGSMNLESYCYSIGFNTYYGKDEYPNQSDDDGVWGISDRSYLKYVAKTLNNISKPFFAGVLTLSSHNPFILPKDAKGLEINKGKYPMHSLATYTDHALREFFEIISHYDWFDSTLFIITADHTGEGSLPAGENRYMSYQIPIFFYHSLSDVSKTRGIMQQTDIMPSIFSYLQIDKPLFLYGNNIFDTTYIPYAVNYLSGIYQFITDDYVLHFDGTNTIAFFNIKTDKTMQNNLVNTLPKEVAIYEQKLKAIIQSYTTRMANNKLFIENKVAK